MSKLHDKHQQWRDGLYGKTVAKVPERQPRFASTSGFEIPPLAGPWDTPGRAAVPGGQPLAGQDASATHDDWYAAQLGFPGQYPFTRGVQPTMYRGRLWTMRQYAGFSTARATNERYKFLLASGQTGLSVAFDLPTQMGYDSDDPMALGEVGKVGVALDTLDDMRALFDGIPQDQVTTSMTINAPAVILLLMYQLVAEEKGARAADLGGTIQNDILKEYMARGTYIFPPGPSMTLTVDSFRYCAHELPQWNMISISGYHIREAGCTAVQEVAFTLADGIEYVQRAVEAGLGVDDFAGRLSFFFNAHNNFLEEVAKFRAARRLWARIMRERFQAKSPKSWMLRFHTQTAGSMLTAQQPYSNVVRVTLQALAAVLGGTQSLHTNSFDEALALPSQQSVELALRTQQVIGYESGVADTIDPLGGAWFIEELTDRIEAGAQAYIAKIDELGGMAAAIERGYPQAEIQQGAYEWQKSVERGERVIVGVNKFQTSGAAAPTGSGIGVSPVDPGGAGVPAGGAGAPARDSMSGTAVHPTGEAEADQVSRLAAYRAHRAQADPGQTWRAECAKLTAMAERGEKSGYCEQIKAALKAGATEGEIVKALEQVWGRYRPAM